MVMERAERRSAASISGVSNLSFDLLSALKAKLDAITAYEIYKRDAHEAGNHEAETFFEAGQRHDQEDVQKLRAMLGNQLQVGQPEEVVANVSSGSASERGGGLAPTHLDDIVDEAVDDSFPASDPPAYSKRTGE